MNTQQQSEQSLPSGESGTMQHSESMDASRQQLSTSEANVQQTDVDGNHNRNNEEERDGDDDDNETVIFLDSVDVQNQPNNPLGWMDPVTEEHRRAVLLQELHRVQRAAFFQFASLCMFPILVIIFVILTVVRDETFCDSPATECALEPRTFINAFTTRCVCEAIPVLRNTTTQF